MIGVSVPPEIPEKSLNSSYLLYSAESLHSELSFVCVEKNVLCRPIRRACTLTNHQVVPRLMSGPLCYFVLFVVIKLLIITPNMINRVPKS